VDTYRSPEDRNASQSVRRWASVPRLRRSVALRARRDKASTHSRPREPSHDQEKLLCERFLAPASNSIAVIRCAASPTARLSVFIRDRVQLPGDADAATASGTLGGFTLGDRELRFTPLRSVEPVTRRHRDVTRVVGTPTRALSTCRISRSARARYLTQVGPAAPRYRLSRAGRASFG